MKVQEIMWTGFNLIRQVPMAGSYEQRRYTFKTNQSLGISGRLLQISASKELTFKL
jgi:hypothetical protein